MKIGILTYPLNNNYGCYLQSYALLHFLKKNGYDVEYIMRRHDKPSLKVYIKYTIKTIVNNICNLKWESPIYNYEWHYMLKKGSRLYTFFDKYIVPHTQPIYDSRRLARVCEKYDIIIVGSDQVWRAEILSNIEDYFLGFVKDSRIIKIAYAASFGNDKPGYSLKQISSCGKALSLFNAVSLREETGLGVMSEYGWKCDECRVVIDPTMLLPKEDYIALASSPLAKPFIFAYILDENQQKNDLINSVSKLRELECVNILKGVTDKNYIYPPIENWLSCYISASFVITDSFHGAVFSIIFNKPFAVIVNQKRGAARFDTLLGTFGLTNRIISEDNSIEMIMQSKIDWNIVNLILNQKQTEAIDFLLKSF